MKHIIIYFCFLLSEFLNSSTDFDKVYGFVKKELRHKNYTQEEILSLLKTQNSDDHRSIRSLVTLLGLRSEQDGYLDRQAFKVFDRLPKQVMNDCRKAMQRTWSLDKDFCYRYLKVDVYALPHDVLIDIQSADKYTRLLPTMLVPELSKSKCDREADLKRKSSFVFDLPFNAVRTENGKLFNRLEKRCTVDDYGYIEIVNLNNVKWQELYFLHELALIDQQSLRGKSVVNYCAHVSAAYKKLHKECKTNFDRPLAWHKKLLTLFNNKDKRSKFELRLQELELS